MALLGLMDEESRRLLDYARTSFDRLAQRSVMFVGGVLIAAIYLDWVVALLGLVLCYCCDFFEMKACGALLKARNQLGEDPRLQDKLRKRLHLSASANTSAAVLFVVLASLGTSAELRSIPIVFLISAALYWVVSQNQIREITRSRSIIVASGVMVMLAVPIVTTTPDMASLLWPTALTIACVFYFVHICAGAYADNYDQLIDQILTTEQSLEEAAQSAQHKSDLLRILSHELRTPLNGVLGMAQLLGLGQLSNQQRFQLATLTSSGERLDELLNDVMDSERLNSGRLRIVKEPVELTTFLKPILDRHRTLADAKGLRFEIEAMTDLPDLVVIDAGRLELCLDHLISNAIKFTESGFVKVTCAHIALPGPPRLTFTIKDTGIGMSRDVQDRIFQRFAQEDMSESRSYGGMGLGLWISKVTAELMGGDLGVRSKQGVGSTFTLHLIAESVTSDGANAVALSQRAGQTVDLAS